MARPPGTVARIWMALAWAGQPLVVRHLKRRVTRGKEDPERWRERLGHASRPRPKGSLVWMHAVGLGEVMALRGVIAQMALRRPDLSFLVTSGTRTSAQVFAANLPPRTQLQFLPWDAAGPSRRFLDHWKPDIAIWAEQEIWPGLALRSDLRGIPLALINARMNARAYEQRARWRAVFADVLPRFSVISAQDNGTAEHLTKLGAPQIQVDGSLKPLAPPLSCQDDELKALRKTIRDRFVWVLASSHGEDEAVGLKAHQILLKRDPDALLIVAPRFPERRAEIAAAVRASGLALTRRSAGEHPDAQVFLADSFGELGLWYRLAKAGFVGGSMSDIEGHNPWEPLALECPVLHGPRIANFAQDYRDLDAAGASVLVQSADALADQLKPKSLAALRAAGQAVSAQRMDRLDSLCDKLVALIPN